jgi:hypothetical protein
MRSKLTKLLFIPLTLLAFIGKAQDTVNVFSDDFTSNTSASWTTSGAIGSSNWSVTRSGADWGARRNTSPAQLELTNDASGTSNANGWVFGSVNNSTEFTAPWNTTLSSNPGLVIWEFNMRTIRTDPAGFTASAYGVGFILAGTSNAPATSGSGYAVILGQSGTTDPIRLVNYNNGLQGTLTNLITSNTTGLTDFGNEYLSIRVTYDPSDDTWELFLRNDGSSAFEKPSVGSLLSQGTVINDTYTSTANMNFMGGYWQGATAGTQTAFFDNVAVYVVQAGDVPLITTSVNSIPSLSGTYGTPASFTIEEFKVTGDNMEEGIEINPPLNFEVSTFPDFSSNVATNGNPITIGSAGTITSTTIFVRLSNSLSVGTYSGDITLSSSGASSKQVTISASNINPLSITASGATADNKVYDGDLTAVVTGGSLIGILPVDSGNVSISEGLFDTKDVANEKSVSIVLTGSKANNYTVSTTLTADITQKELTIVSASAQNKIFDGSSSTLISGILSGVIAPDVVDFTKTAQFDNPNPGLNKPVTFTGNLTGADAGNYSLTAPTGLTANIFACPDNVYWAFTSDLPDSSTVGSKVTISALGRGNNNGTTTLINSTSASSGYTGASGGNNAGAAAFTGALNTSSSTYFEFTLTPETLRTVTLAGISFGSRSTSTGPAAYSIRSSADGYASNLATGTLSTSGIWQLQTPTLVSITSEVSTSITFRIYGHNGTGSPGAGTANWRIDDLRLVLATSPAIINSTINACNAYTWPVNNQTYTSSTTVSEVVDCDTFNLNLTITSGSTTTTTVSACSSYVWSVNSQTYTSSIIDTVVSGCDTSILNLTITAPPTWYLDADNDGWYVSTQQSCTSPGLDGRAQCHWVGRMIVMTAIPTPIC